MLSGSGITLANQAGGSGNWKAEGLGRAGGNDGVGEGKGRRNQVGLGRNIGFIQGGGCSGVGLTQG